MMVIVTLLRAMRTCSNGAADVTDGAPAARVGDVDADDDGEFDVSLLILLIVALLDSNRVTARRTALTSVSSAARSSDDSAMMIAPIITQNVTPR